LLGWHELAAGTVRVDGADLGAERLAALREDTAWVDAQIHLFAATLLGNVRFGRERASGETVTRALAAAEIERLLERMPQGLQTNLGEGGTLVSGGEGQQVRIARAWLRDGARLAILDEPGRGLAREKRRALVRATRARLGGATLLCVTHDIEHTLSFPRVVVVDGGRVVEDGVPSALAAATASRYRALLDEESRVRRELWADPAWRRWQLADGALRESAGEWVAGEVVA
jgi:ABC-type transport system involved in cytochrome bd biosynthesis fused ATPase/permease subunit